MNNDFPFYNGAPVRITGPQWSFVMLAAALGFLALVWPGWAGLGMAGGFLSAVLFCAIPLLGLARVAPRHWTAIFHRVGLREIGWMISFALLNIVVSSAAGFVVIRTVGAAPNAATAALDAQSGPERVAFFLKTAVQLFGEELVTILPLLLVLWLLFDRLGLSRRAAVIGAWVASAVLFGLLHLPTYQWNLVQCLVVIGSARLVLSLAYLKTKNIWVSTGAHILNDWILFSVSLLGTFLLRR